jgi:hypothetical protein
MSEIMKSNISEPIFLYLGPYLVRLTSKDVRFVAGQHKDSSENTVVNTKPSATALFDTTADPYMKSVTATNPGTTNNSLPGDVLIGYFQPLNDLPDTFLPSMNG